MKKISIVFSAFICITVCFVLCACQSTRTEDLYTQQEIALANNIYEFANNHIYEDDSYLTMISLHIEDECFLEFMYTTEGYYKSKKTNGGMKSLGFPTSFCYKVDSEGVIDKKYSGSLGGFDGAVENTTWYIDGEVDDNLVNLYDFAREIINRGN